MSPSTQKSRRSPRGASGPRRLLALEVGGSQSLAVLLSRNQGVVKWQKAALLPAFDQASGSGQLWDAVKEAGLRAEYASLVSVEDQSILRVVNFPGQVAPRERLSQQVRQTLGVDDSYALAFQVMGKRCQEESGEYSVLCSALPLERSGQLRDWVLSNGSKPASLVCGGVAVANLVQAIPGFLQDGAGTGILHVGEKCSDLLLFHGRELAVARQFRFGKRLLVEALMNSMKLERETAEQFLRSGSFDMSYEAGPVLEPWLHQVEISLDFIDRRYGRTIEQLYLFGEGGQSRTLELILGSAVGRRIVAWNPLAQLAGLSPPAGLHEDPRRFVRPLSEGLRVMGAGSSCHAV